MLAMITVNAIFAAYEIALASIPLSRVQRLAERNFTGAKAAVAMKQNMEGSLAVVQLGITLVGAIAAATGGAGAEETIAPFLQESMGVPPGFSDLMAIACIVIPLTVITIVFGELIPKVFALRNAEWVALRLSPAMRCFAFAAFPLVFLLESAVRILVELGSRRWQASLDQQFKADAAELQELRESVAIARTSRLIGAQQEKIILGATSLSQRPVGEIMLPAEFISMLDVNASIGECLIAAHLDMHTRFPVTERAGDPQAISGYVNFKDIVAHMRLAPKDPTLRGILRNIPSLPQTMQVATCLDHLIREHSHIALIRNAQAHVVGLVTLEDMIEELVGEIEDEYDRLPTHVVATGTGWVVGGGISLERVRDITGLDLTVDLPAQGARTMSEWVLGHLQSAVRGGEILERQSWRVVVRKARRQKVLEAQLELQRPSGERNPNPTPRQGFAAE
jgi:putative hemolysin